MTFDIAFYDDHHSRVGDGFLIEAENMLEALKRTVELLPTIQGNAHIVETWVEEVDG